MPKERENVHHWDKVPPEVAKISWLMIWIWIHEYQMKIWNMTVETFSWKLMTKFISRPDKRQTINLVCIETRCHHFGALSCTQRRPPAGRSTTFETELRWPNPQTHPSWLHMLLSEQGEPSLTIELGGLVPSPLHATSRTHFGSCNLDKTLVNLDWFTCCV